jgi:hypothetical protein
MEPGVADVKCQSSDVECVMYLVRLPSDQISAEFSRIWSLGHCTKYITHSTWDNSHLTSAYSSHRRSPGADRISDNLAHIYIRVVENQPI